MKQDLTELVLILDRSSSMRGLESETITGFNTMLQQQQEGAGVVLLSTVLVSTASQVLHDRVDIRQAAPLTGESYQVGGRTALLDAIGGAIHHVRNVHKYARPEDVPQHILFVILTDGMENASRHYTVGRIRRRIEEQKQAGWEFLFLGANQDAIKTAGSMGIDPERAVNYRSDNRGTRLNYQVLSEAITSVRRKEPLDHDWKNPIVQDFSSRGKKRHI